MKLYELTEDLLYHQFQLRIRRSYDFDGSYVESGEKYPTVTLTELNLEEGYAQFTNLEDTADAIYFFNEEEDHDFELGLS